MDLIPHPANLRGVQKASEGGGPIAPEDTTLGEMREVYVDVISPASPGVNDGGERSYETSIERPGFVPTWRKRIRPSCTRVFVGQLWNDIM